MIQQSVTEESKMPPRCCTQPIPADTVQQVLTRENQQAFLKAVVQFSTPWEARIFCPKPSCGEFVPRRHKVDVKQPFNVTCHQCNTRICVMCKRNAHPVGRDCPEDWELEQVLKMGEKSGWRRCYKCRNLVELAQGCTHMTCRCKAQFCYICGGVWDATVGCPNVCNGEEELERRRLEEEDRKAELEAERIVQEAAAAASAAERLEAQQRSENHPLMKDLLKAQWEEKQRFDLFDTAMRSGMRERQQCRRRALVEKQTDLEEKMKERHAKTAAQLEDRQVAAELELRTTLDQSERSVRIRLKHMEAYCDGLGKNTGVEMPQRTVTERDLRELGQQYNLRDNLERIHQSKINVLRDRQAKRMEELLERQEAELDKLESKRQEELEDLAAKFAHETDQIQTLESARKQKLQHRWSVSVEVLCKELEDSEGSSYAKIPGPSWPTEEQTENELELETPQA